MSYLLHGHAIEIVLASLRDGPANNRELAKALGLTPISVMYHLNEMEKSGKIIYNNGMYMTVADRLKEVTQLYDKAVPNRLEQLELKVNTLMALLATTGRQLEQRFGNS